MTTDGPLFEQGAPIAIFCGSCKQQGLGLVGWCGADVCEGCYPGHCEKCQPCRVSAFPMGKAKGGKR